DTVIASGNGDPGVGDCYTYNTSNLVSDGFNLSDDPAAGNCQLTAFGDHPATNPMLGPLQDNGGPTQTMTLGAGSPAIDAGNPSGSLTTPVSAGAGGVNVPAATNLSGLHPNTTYHYRLIATNGDGATTGGDRSFKTRPPPFLGASIRTTSAKLDPHGRAPVKL